MSTENKSIGNLELTVEFASALSCVLSAASVTGNAYAKVMREAVSTGNVNKIFDASVYASRLTHLTEAIRVINNSMDESIQEAVLNGNVDLFQDISAESKAEMQELISKSRS